MSFRGGHAAHVNEIARFPLFKNAVLRMETQKLLNLHHNASLCYH